MLQVQNLCKKYNNTVILDDISFDVNDGEFVSILGPSGCGKTTLLRILVGLIAPTSGTIWKDQRDITHVAPSDRRMGIVFQNYALFESMTVLENVEYALRIKKATKSRAREEAVAILERLDMDEQLMKKPRDLSGGQQQRVAIARTLVLHPDVILFDEPMSALDVATRLSMRKIIKSIQSEYGSTMIYITHDQEEAFSMSDRILVMETSHVVQIGTPNDIILHPKNDYVRSFVIDNLRAKMDSILQFAYLESIA